MFKNTISMAVSAAMLGGCATMKAPSNMQGSQYAPQQQLAGSFQPSSCQSAALAPEQLPPRHVASADFSALADMLSSGDRVQLKIAGDTDRLSGIYVLAANGAIMLDGRYPIDIAGKSLPQAEQAIGQLLLQKGQIRNLRGNVRLELLELGGVNVAVSGAVFEPGMIRVGERTAETRGVNLREAKTGDRNISRMLTAALRAAGGVRPDADLSAVYLLRGDEYARIDLSGAISGHLIDDIALTSHDRIIVGSAKCFQEALVKPSQITMPGIRVYMSNLSRPANSNASSVNNREGGGMPYGTRLSQAVVSANCVGGSAMNAARRVVLMSRNPINGQSVVIERSVEKLLRGKDRDQRDPYLMPGDSLACYDSMAMNVRDVISLVGETASPYFLFKNLD